MVSELYQKDVFQLGKLIDSGATSPTEIVQSFLSQIDKHNERLNAFVTVLRETAISAADKATAEISRGQKRGLLHGIPIAHKDLYSTEGILTTAGSEVLAKNIPESNATVVDKLDEAGMIMLGKLNTHEFAYGPTGEFSKFGATRNPWDVTRITGGSSSGSAGAVAAGLVPIATGSDTGGSIRMPAACCGLTGIKPTYGRVSRHGITPLCWSMDHSGPLARSAVDCALFLQACSGYDKNDRATSTRPVPDFMKNIGSSLKGIKIGIPRRYFFDSTQDTIVSFVEDVLKFFETEGAILVEVDIENIEHAATAALAIYLSEATAYHEDNLKECSELYTDSVRGFLELGNHILAKDYLAAQRYRTLLGQSMATTLTSVDIIATPGLTVTAPKLGETAIEINGVETDVFSTMLHNTEPFDLTGLPAIVFPCGFDNNNLPASIQLIGKPFDESLILNAANIYQQNFDWHLLRPTI